MVITSIVQSIGYIYLLFSVNPFIIGAIVLVSIINAFFQGKTEKYSYEAEMEIVRPNRRGSYLDYICSDFGYVKDIKLFHIQDWVLNKRDYYNQIKLNSFDKVSRKFIFLGIVSTLTNTLLNMVVYFYLIWQLTFGRIAIGDFTMYLSAITNFAGSINTLFSSVVKFTQVDRYLSNYISFRELKNKVDYLDEPQKSLFLDEPLTIEFRHVSFHYPKKEYIKTCLKNRPSFTWM